ncbi:MAG: hypothetical protein DME65_14985 [Verrucomicrobia bacterium]|nr:MAG: hypothetical protein DME65_14985 [Verrucomicrobiota bacterium]
MPLLRQLELPFHSTGILSVVRTDSSPGELVAQPTVSPCELVFVGQALRLPNPATATEAVALRTTARELLRAHGALLIANELRVEWNSRLSTVAGRADYRQKLISLNPRLVEHPSEIDRTLRHELAHILAQFRAGRRRIPPHGEEWRQACIDLGIAGEKRCHNLPFPARTHPARFVYGCPNCGQEFPRVRRMRRALACLACCRKHNRGEFHPRYRLKLIR